MTPKEHGKLGSYKNIEQLTNLGGAHWEAQFFWGCINWQLYSSSTHCHCPLWQGHAIHRLSPLAGPALGHNTAVKHDTDVTGVSVVTMLLMIRTSKMSLMFHSCTRSTVFWPRLSLQLHLTVTVGNHTLTAQSARNSFTFFSVSSHIWGESDLLCIHGSPPTEMSHRHTHQSLSSSELPNASPCSQSPDRKAPRGKLSHCHVARTA